MNCETTQHELLGSESPDRPNADVLAHLDACPACRDWQTRLVQIEHNISRLPVPGSATRDAFLLDLVLPDNPSDEVAVAPKARPVAAPVAHPGPLVRLSLPNATRQPTPPLRVLAYQWRYQIGAAAAAAAILFALVGIFANRGNQPDVVKAPRVKPAPDPLVANLMQRNLSLVSAADKKVRTEALTKMADDLGRESQAVAKAENGEELAGLLVQLRTKVNDALKQLEHPEVPAVVVADTADAARVKQLVRNRGIIQTLVDGGIRIAKEEDSLVRADSCSELARGLATEIRQAAGARDSDRTAEMGQHLQDLLKGGVAGNIRTIRNRGDVSIIQKEKMEQVRDWVKDVTTDVENQLRLASDSETKQTLEAIRGAYRQVDNAVRG